MKKEVWIVKASGEKEVFSVEKLRHSLEKSRASSQIIEEVINRVVGELKDGTKTLAIYRRAFSYLRRKQPLAAGRYNIKKAMLELGPTGYPFEKIIAEILRVQGFSIEVGKILQGLCVSHEIDVIAKNKKRFIMVEGKFHNKAGYKTDVKVALYIKARFDDVVSKLIQQPVEDGRLKEAWLVTNTKLTSDAIKYATCSGIKTIGWNHPPEGSLQQLIERSGLQPLTCLNSLTGYQKKQLIARGFVLCRELMKDKSILASIGLNETGIARVMQETEELCRKEKTIDETSES